MLTEIGSAIAFTSLTCWSIWVFRRQQRIIREVQRQKVRIQTEERRLFEFLHSIGTALKEDAKPGDLHGSIVEGALGILEAQGGALYLANKDGSSLKPVYISRTPVPFVELPPMPGATQRAVFNELKIHSVAAGDGMIGDAYTQDSTTLIRQGDARLAPARAFGANSAFVASLTYAGQRLGVLAVARCGGEPFGQEHASTMRAIVEQSAFSLWDAILHQEAAEKKQIEKDLVTANEVQRILLPTESPDLPGFEIAGMNVPARHLSGDYFDFIPLDDFRCGIVIADVSGKGVPAALIMAMCRGALRQIAPDRESPAEALRRLNAQLYPDIKEDMFISMAYAIIDRRDTNVRLARAGHDAPVVFRAATGNVETVKPPGMAVGIDSGVAFNKSTLDFSLPLAAGDCLVLYTDGVTEALNRAGDEFGVEAMKRAIQASAPEGAAAVVRRVAEEVRAFVGDYSQHDDITLIAIKKK